MVVGDFGKCAGLGTAFLLNQLREANGKPEWGHCKYTHEYFRPGNTVWDIDTGKFIDIPPSNIKPADIQPKYMITAREYDTFKYLSVLGSVKNLSGVIYKNSSDIFTSRHLSNPVPLANIPDYIKVVEDFNREYGVYVMPFSPVARSAYRTNLAKWSKSFIHHMNGFTNMQCSTKTYNMVIDIWDQNIRKNPALIHLSYKELFLDYSNTNTIFDTRKEAFKEYTINNQKDVFEPWMDILDIK